MKDCLFCKIVAGEIPSSKVYEDERVLAFRDIDPKAPVHVLVIPKKHAASVLQLGDGEYEIAAHILRVMCQLSKELGLEGGFRIVTNTGPDGGQSVDHLHFHLLGGRAMGWPPG